MPNPALSLLLSRRSVVAKDLCEPGPSDHELEQILAAGHRVPDHKKLGPWRFILIKGEHRQAFGDSLAHIFKDAHPNEVDAVYEFESQRFVRAPIEIAIIYSPVENPKAPEWEQQLAVGAVCQNVLNASSALGYGAQWLTEWYSYDDSVNRLLGLATHEKIAGFIYIGNVNDTPKERARPSLDDRVTRWQPK